MSVKRLRDRSADLRNGSRARATTTLAGGDSARRTTAAKRAPTPLNQPSVPAALPSTIGNIPLPDFQKLSVNLARATEEGQKALATYMKPIEQGQAHSEIATQVADCVST